MKESKIENRKSKIAGFTLTELLVAIAIFVILMAMAVPVLRTLTGSRSIAAATNVLSATLSRIRMEAIGSQQYRGVMFYLDQNTGRVGMVTLRPSEYVPPLAANWNFGQIADVALDLDYSVINGVRQYSDSVLLPPGMGLMTVIGNATGGNRYVGYFDGVVGQRAGGCIVFTPEGRLFTGVPGMVIRQGATHTALGDLIYGSTASPAFEASSWFYPTLSVCLFESDPLLAQYANGSHDAWWDDPMYAAPEPAKEIWLDNNATPFLINRYNGTLIKGE